MSPESPLLRKKLNLDKIFHVFRFEGEVESVTSEGLNIRVTRTDPGNWGGWGQTPTAVVEFTPPGVYYNISISLE